MNYQRIYEDIISNAKLKNRKKLNKHKPNYEYFENHHIIPKCLAGTNDSENLVLLTAREHFICHKLLHLIYPHNTKLTHALHRITFSKMCGKIVSSRDYEYIKHFAILGINNGMFNKKHGIEAKAKIGNANRGEKNGLRKLVKNNPNVIKGENNHASKSYKIITPTNDIVEIKGLRKYCEDHKLYHTNMIKVANGKQDNHKGYKCERLN